jgi:hypothetical protein
MRTAWDPCRNNAAWRWRLGAALLVLGCTAEIGGNSPSSNPGEQPAGASGSSSGGGNGSGSEPGRVPFAPARGSFKRLTATELENSLTALLGPVRVGDLEPDTWLDGFAKVGSSTVSVSPSGVEKYQSVIESATAEVFADAARRDALVGCVPQASSDTACFRSFVERFGRLAWRRGLTPEQIERYSALAASLSQTLGDTADGLRETTNALLLSPNFLYRLERGQPDASTSFWRYSAYEVASRLAFFLTNSTPDDALLTVAEQGRLDAPDGIRAEAERLLASAPGRESVGNFASELFQLGIIAGRAKDPGLFPSYTPALQQAMMREVTAMLQDVVFDQAAPVTDFYTTRTTYVNADLAQLYGLDAAGLTSDSWVKVTLPQDGLRAGYLGTGAFLSQFANQKEGSPTTRGKSIRMALLCEDIPDPPKDVSTVFADTPPGVMVTKRQKLEQHRAKGGTCVGCHALMDPLGLPLENFDAIGAFRETENGLPIDVSGELDGVPLNGAVELGRQLSLSPKAAACLVRHLYRYATGLLEAEPQEAAISQLLTQFEADGRDFKKLMVNLVASDGFRFVAPAE